MNKDKDDEYAVQQVERMSKRVAKVLPLRSLI